MILDMRKFLCGLAMFGTLSSSKTCLASQVVDAENTKKLGSVNASKESDGTATVGVGTAGVGAGRYYGTKVLMDKKSAKSFTDNVDAKTQAIMNIVLIGPPGSGKGTHFEIISKKYGIDHYSTGDMLRDAVAKRTEYGKIAEKYMNNGELVPSYIVEELTKQNLVSSEKGHVIDGSPRSVSEAKYLDSLGVNIGAVVYLDVSDNEILKRISGRRVCGNKECGASYHVLNNKPNQNGICDKCGSNLTQREDDKYNTVLNRLKVFHEQTEPVLEYYEKQGKLIRINGEGSIEEIKSRLLEALNNNEILKKYEVK